ncbi:hypothetical protein OpiT1DRAFT_02186 [Opitutaceae bacterium TAV1]|nr:hypothetical protein OpiT1DRAFT_02186 [Opitutaceae bacterium TAV1]
MNSATTRCRFIVSTGLAGALLVSAFLQPAVASIPPRTPLPSVYTLPPQALADARTRLTAGPEAPDLAPAIKQLRAEADAALERKPVSVLDKNLVPASGDKHDYVSIGPYWWPNPSTADGLPWISRDGHNSPHSLAGTDRNAFAATCNDTLTLGLAWYLTGYEPYARHAARILRVWFLDQSTRMNPNLRHAQSVPGRTDGDKIGVIDGAIFVSFLDGLALVETSPVWTPADAKAMRAWFTDYLVWLTTSPQGRGAAAMSNNHGTWYDAQLSQIALFLGHNELARTTLGSALARRLETQVDDDGSQPHEVIRASPLGYSTFNANGFLCLALQASHVDQNLAAQWWGNPLFRKAIEYIAPYADSRACWISPHGKGGNQTGARLPIRTLLAKASGNYTDEAFRTLLTPQLTGPNASDYAAERWHFFVARPNP